jgi:hypothetical protein
MRSVSQTRTLGAADPNGICLDQQAAGPGNLLINGAFATGGAAPAVLDQQRQVELESAGNLIAINFTITGTDESGNIVEETIAGPNAGTVATAVNFKTVTQIAVDAAVGTDVEIGTNAVGASQEVPLDQNVSPFNVSLGLIITVAAVDVTVQFTFDDVFADNSGPFAWFDHSDLTNIVADDEATIVSPVKAVRVLTNSGVGTCRFEVAQAGIQ